MTKALIPNDALEGVMKKVFLERSVSPGLFWDALLKANLYIPVPTSAQLPSADEKGPEELSEIPMILGEDAKGKRVIWLFTSPKAMTDYTERTMTFLEMASMRLLDHVRDSEYEVVLIGPSGLTLNLHRDLISSLAEGRVPEEVDEQVRTIAKEAQVFVGSPTDDTSNLIGIFIDLFKTLPNVLEASFLQVADDSGSRLLLGLRLEKESREELRAVTEKVAKTAEGTLDRGKSMDVTLINGSLKEAFKKWGRSFYVK